MRLQQELTEARAGETVQIDPERDGREIEGTWTIDRPLTLDGQGATLWSSKGPILNITTSAPVSLLNLNVEVTGEDSVDGERLAVRAANNGTLTTSGVRIRGGIEGAEDRLFWQYPLCLQIRRFAGKSVVWRLHAPVKCTVEWDVTNVEAGQVSVDAGTSQTITMRVVPDAPPRSPTEGIIRIMGDDKEVLVEIPVFGWVRHFVASKTQRRGKTFVASLVGGLLTASSLVGAALAGWWFICPPKLVLSPQHIDLGTRVCSTRGGTVETELTFDAKWQTTIGATQLTARLDYNIWSSSRDSGERTSQTYSYETLHAVTGRNNRVSIPFPVTDVDENADFFGTLQLVCSPPGVVIAPTNALPFRLHVRLDSAEEQP